MSDRSVCPSAARTTACDTRVFVGSSRHSLSHRSWAEGWSRFCSSPSVLLHTGRHSLTTPSILTTDRPLRHREEERSKPRTPEVGTATACGPFVPGQACRKHGRLSNWAPPQEPPGRASLRMFLWRKSDPRPHDTLHRLQDVQGDRIQSTGGTNRPLSIPQST